MTARPLSLLSLCAFVAACAPSVPDSGAGVGFQDYNSYIRNSYSGSSPAGVSAAPAAAAPTGFDPAAAAAAIDRAEGVSAPLTTPPMAAPMAGLPPANTGIRPRGDAPAGIKVENGEVIHSNPGISDENDFNAVASRETIESDAQRIARNRSEYVVVQPGAIPVRQGESGPNIVQFALATTHAPGVQMYKRGRARDATAACARYASPDLAQQDFLARGGPDKDRNGLDPDGDGFACGWDPRPFRTALQ
ncbi:hypothetical protein [Pseudogemmobacter faecipullorum]|uniref:Excalibur calcium-binding domain-containing protein n=1 Tax=Pseudogemmobacter faecipullorum TaxID=2755041 RepID=A0ABS8CLL7_9RHOB|nr:hypothetical protein [Pseudogemmobacter faecipullorum]MCB5410231.1 hypothetical protein [Pseudogemmobacter faecipullorum]